MSERHKKQKVEGYEQGPEWYDKSFEKNEHWREHYTQSRYYPLWTVISDRIMRAGTNSVLDVGCGPGQLASLLRDKGVPRYLGLDFSSKRVQRAKEVCPEFDFMVADAFETGIFHTHDYDTVVCAEFLEHVERDLELVEMIRTGTRFYATVPDFPFESHVRHFGDAQQAYDRYAKYFQGFTVDAFLFGNKGRTLYLIEGTKR